MKGALSTSYIAGVHENPNSSPLQNNQEKQ